MKCWTPASQVKFEESISKFHTLVSGKKQKSCNPHPSNLERNLRIHLLWSNSTCKNEDGTCADQALPITKNKHIMKLSSSSLFNWLNPETSDSTITISPIPLYNTCLVGMTTELLYYLIIGNNSAWKNSKGLLKVSVKL